MVKRAAGKIEKRAGGNALRRAEQALREIEKALGDKQFKNVGERNDFLATLTGATQLGRDAMPPPDAQAEAQELAFDAMEAPTKAQALKLARQALTLDPDCVDALGLLAELQAKSAKQRIAGLEKALAAGERSLGPAFFKQNKGDFWALIETRPYMRLREQLAAALVGEELYPEAIAHYEALLKLNPNDNQGVRYSLLGLYLTTGNVGGAGRLLKTYKNDSMVTFAWCRVLERFLTGDLPAAETALEQARRQNRFVELYLTMQRDMPKRFPTAYSLGSEEEAIVCLHQISVAWAENPSATFWLMQQLLQNKAQEEPATRRPKSTRLGRAEKGTRRYGN